MGVIPAPNERVARRNPRRRDAARRADLDSDLSVAIAALYGGSAIATLTKELGIGTLYAGAVALVATIYVVALGA